MATPHIAAEKGDFAKPSALKTGVTGYKHFFTFIKT